MFLVASGKPRAISSLGAGSWLRTDAFEAVHGDEAKAWADAYVIGISADALALGFSGIFHMGIWSMVSGSQIDFYNGYWGRYIIYNGYMIMLYWSIIFNHPIDGVMQI
jgi:hypothetical protein